jgi:two-component system chemotaxis response regulator CheY
MIKKVLIVDDSPIARKILKKCLPDGHGFELTEAGNGHDGFQLYKEHRPDITFLDLTMPVMDGFQALELIKSFNEDAVVIVATADVQMKTIFRVMDAGALMVLKKPLTKEAVADALEKAGQELVGRG